MAATRQCRRLAPKGRIGRRGSNPRDRRNSRRLRISGSGWGATDKACDSHDYLLARGRRGSRRKTGAGVTGAGAPAANIPRRPSWRVSFSSHWRRDVASMPVRRSTARLDWPACPSFRYALQTIRGSPVLAARLSSIGGAEPESAAVRINGCSKRQRDRRGD